jgi:predicted SAM-dependent methyltransferase
LEDVEEESGSNIETKFEQQSVSLIHYNRSPVHEYASRLTETLCQHHDFLEPSGQFDVVIVANNLEEVALSDKESDKNNKSHALTEQLIGDLRQSGYEPEPDPKVVTISKPAITFN